MGRGAFFEVFRRMASGNTQKLNTLPLATHAIAGCRWSGGKGIRDRLTFVGISCAAEETA
jgi:hypothetical protein